MANFNPSSTPGTTRRRAKSIIIHNPAVPTNLAEGETAPLPSVTFVMEDRVIMEDGNDIFIPRGNMVLLVDSALLATEYPSINSDTGVIDNNNTRYGGQLLEVITKALEDIFITEGMKRVGR